MKKFILILTATLLTATALTQPAGALITDGFKAGNIIDDAVFTNKSSMTVSQIQSFLNSKVPSCDTKGEKLSEFGGPDLNGDGKVQRWEWGKSRYNQTTFPCLRDYRENNKSSAQIIYDVSQKYSINPQVLIVLLQKEQALVTDTWPLTIQFKTATGYGCPDTAPCDTQYYGLTNQLDWAAKMFRAILNNTPTWYTPYVLGNNYIQYSPNSSCGGSTVNIQNRSTQALYNYTPYQPNAAALKAEWGTAPCGAYGNRNFYSYFKSWFGTTHYVIKGSIKAYYDSYGGSSKLGQPILNEATDGKGTWWQCFEKGCIIGSGKTGFWESKGSIRNYWASLGYQKGALGLPTGPEKSLPTGGWMQSYENGVIIGRSDTGYWASKGSIRPAYLTMGGHEGNMGYPTGPEQTDGLGVWWQQYENGFIIGANGKFVESRGLIREYWASTGYQHGSLGLPISSVYTERDGGIWQQYNKGYIIKSPTAQSAWESKGAIRSHWAKLGYQNGPLGYPISAEAKAADGTWSQNYENGSIYYKSGKSWDIRK